METEILLNMDINGTFHIKQFKRGNFYITLLSWNSLKRKVCQKKCCSCFSHFLDDRYGASPEALGAVDIVVE